MNILHVSAVLSWGGGENHIENLCYELKKNNPEVNNIIVCAEGGVFHNRLKTSGLDFETAPRRFKMDLRFSLKIIRLCEKYKIDLIHIHDPTALTLTVMADKFYNLPDLVFSKKTTFPIRNKKPTLYKYNYPKIKKYLCVSNATKEITAKSIIDKDKIVTIYHGTNIDTKSSETPFQLREKFSIDSNTLIIGVIGNHIEAKDFETLVATINHLVNVRNRKNIICIQIGNYTNKTENLLKMVGEFKLESHIKFLGYQPKASNFIPQFDMLAVTSQSEGIPQVIYESFYHKVPVVSTNVGGIPEIIENGINGLLVPSHSPELLSEKIEYLIENKDLQNTFVKVSYEKLISGFTTKIMATKTLEQYTAIING